MGLLPPGHATWFTAAGEAAESAGKLDDGPALFAIGAALRDTHETSPAALPARLAATAQAAHQVYNLGNYELGAALIGRIEASARLLDEPGLLARVHQARSARAMFAGDVGAYLESELAAANAFERAGDLRFACMQRGHVGYACLEIGAYAQAERNLREVLEQATRLGLSNVVATAKHNLGRALRHLGLYDEALAIEREAVELFRAHGDRRLEGASLVYLGQIREALGDLVAAEADIRAALPSARSPMRPYYLASLASVLLASGRNDEALDIAREANTLLAELGAVEEGEAVSRLVYAEALLACGERDEARVATLHAMARIDERAARISDPEWRRSFLERIPEIVRTFELARMLGLR